MKKKKLLADKIREAKERTRQWALGVNVKFPEEKTKEKPAGEGEFFFSLFFSLLAL